MHISEIITSDINMAVVLIKVKIQSRVNINETIAYEVM